VPRGRERSIAQDLEDFLKEHIVPLKKGEVVKGSPVKYCLDCGRKKWTCRCHKQRSK
jgi:DTW domain-containing protein YfiP